MRQEIERWLATQGRRWSPGTVKAYRWYMLKLADWLEEKGYQEVTESALTRWMDGSMGWGEATTYTAIVACRGFFRWQLGREASPAEKLVLPRRTNRPQRTFDQAHVMKILGALDTSTARGTRDTAIVCLLLDTGLRAAEVCRLRIEHVDFAERHFTVRIKGGRWAEGVFSPYTSSCLVAWLTQRALVAKKDVPELFVSIGGETPGRKLTTDGLRCNFRKLGEQLGFPVSAHDFRRTFATLALKGGASTRLVQIAGRWSSSLEVERYSQSLTASDFDQYSPVHHVLGLRLDGEV